MMIAKIPKEVNLRMLEAMHGPEYSPSRVKSVNNANILELDPLFADVWHKPEGLPDVAKVYHYAEERVENGRAYVIAGLRGEQFRPTHSSRKENWQARFTLNRYMELSYFKQDDTLIISMVGIIEHDETYQLNKEELYVGYPEDVPARFLYLEKVISAVIAKGECKDCKHIHYSQENF